MPTHVLENQKKRIESLEILKDSLVKAFSECGVTKNCDDQLSKLAIEQLKLGLNVIMQSIEEYGDEGDYVHKTLPEILYREGLDEIRASFLKLFTSIKAD